MVNSKKAAFYYKSKYLDKKFNIVDVKREWNGLIVSWAIDELIKSGENIICYYNFVPMIDAGLKEKLKDYILIIDKFFMPEEDIDLDNITEPQEPTDFPIPTEPSDDSNDPTFDEITIKDYDYWKRYFALATVISIPYLADGFDIPPTMTPIPLPCIYICFNTIFIKQLNLVIVIGLALRGIWPWPVKGNTVNTYVGGELYASYEIISVTSTTSWRICNKVNNDYRSDGEYGSLCKQRHS